MHVFAGRRLLCHVVAQLVADDGAAHALVDEIDERGGELQLNHGGDAVIGRKGRGGVIAVTEVQRDIEIERLRDLAGELLGALHALEEALGLLHRRARFGRLGFVQFLVELALEWKA